MDKNHEKGDGNEVVHQVGVLEVVLWVDESSEWAEPSHGYAIVLEDLVALVGDDL